MFFHPSKDNMVIPWHGMHLALSRMPPTQVQQIVAITITCGSDGKESACRAGDPGSIPGPGRSPGEGNGNPLQYSCLKNTVDRRAWPATVYGVAKSWTRLSDFTLTFHFHALEKGMATHSSILA